MTTTITEANLLVCPRCGKPRENDKYETCKCNSAAADIPYQVWERAEAVRKGDPVDEPKPIRTPETPENPLEDDAQEGLTMLRNHLGLERVEGESYDDLAWRIRDMFDNLAKKDIEAQATPAPDTPTPLSDEPRAI